VGSSVKHLFVLVTLVCGFEFRNETHTIGGFQKGGCVWLISFCWAQRDQAKASLKVSENPGHVAFVKVRRRWLMRGYHFGFLQPTDTQATGTTAIHR
ncbi:hypothetical protein HID58_042179, partial [Brassica napus]